MEPDQVITERWNLLWAIQRSQRYHSRRSSFFSRWNKLTSFIGVVGGSAVFASVNTAVPGWVATIGAVVVVLLSGADLVVGTSDMARNHNDLRRRFCELEADIVSREIGSITGAEIAGWKGRRLSIESDEPPTYVALNVLCEIELRRAYGMDLLKDSENKLSPWRHFTAHLFIWENS